MPTTIICKLKRKGGSKIDLFGKVYHFKPASGDGTDPDIDHECDIPDSEARALYRFLQIKEAYALKDPDAVLPAKPKADPGQTIGNEAPKKDDKPDIIITDGDGNQINLSAMEPEDLRTLAKETFNISVHHKWNDQTVIAKIIEKTRGED